MTAAFSCSLLPASSPLALASWPVPGLPDYVLKDPVWLLALAVPFLLLWLRSFRRVPVLLVPFSAAWHRPSLASFSRWPVILALLGLLLLVVALARPQRIEDKREVHSQGYDIMLAIDLSGSMLAEDYERGDERINRLMAIKPVIQAFIDDRPNDRIGIVVFSGRAYTLAPLTFDHDWLSKQTDRLKIGLIEDGTAIGDGLGVALTRLEQAKRESGGKRSGAFVVLLTDGVNNRGSLTPEQATEIAQKRGIPVYTIGAGKDGIVPFPVFDDKGNKIGYRRMVADLDEVALQQISDATGGHFFRAADTNTITSAFKAIDRAQKIEFQAKTFVLSTELFGWFAAPGGSLLLLGALFARSMRAVPQSAGAYPGSLPPESAAAEPASKPRPHPVLLGSTVLLVAVNMVWGYLAAMQRTGNVAYALGAGTAYLVVPGLIALLFAIFRTFRTPQFITLIMFSISLLSLAGNVLRLR